MLNKKYLSSSNIKVSAFLMNYYDIPYFEGMDKLTHKQMKTSFGIKSLPFTIVKEEEILQGEFLIVKDKKGECLPYANPKRKIKTK